MDRPTLYFFLWSTDLSGLLFTFSLNLISFGAAASEWMNPLSLYTDIYTSYEICKASD